MCNDNIIFINKKMRGLFRLVKLRLALMNHQLFLSLQVNKEAKSMPLIIVARYFVFPDFLLQTWSFQRTLLGKNLLPVWLSALFLTGESGAADDTYAP